MLCLFTVTKGKGNSDLYFVKRCCWLLCKQKCSGDLNTPGDVFITGLVVFYHFHVYFKLWEYAESGIWFQMESRHSRLMGGFQFSSHSVSILLSLNGHPWAPDWKCYSQMSYRSGYNKSVVLNVLSETIFLLKFSVVDFRKPNIQCKVLSHRHFELNTQSLKVPTNTITDLHMVVYL